MSHDSCPVPHPLSSCAPHVGTNVLLPIDQAKGLEWDEVFMPGLTEGSLPLLPSSLLPNSIELVEHIEEERR